MKENINDIIRSRISKKLVGKSTIEYEKEIETFYNEIKNNPERNILSIDVLYSTSFMINYLTYSMFPDDYVVKNEMACLLGFSSIYDFVRKVDKNTFKKMCEDVITFYDSCYFVRKKYVLKSLEQNEKIIRMAPNYLMDVCTYSKEFNVNDIISEYNKSYQFCNDKDEALEDTICYAIEILFLLYDNDIENYKIMMHNITNVYYAYNRYLLLTGSEMDENARDIMIALEDDVESSIMYLLNDNEALEPIIRDYLTYEILDEAKKKEIHAFNKNPYSKRENEIVNPNDRVRSFLKKLYYQINPSNNPSNEEDLEKNETLENLKDSPYFDCVVDVLYIDSMYMAYMDYMASLSDEDKYDYEYIKDMNSISEFKMYLLDSNVILLDAILKSLSFYDFSLMSKKDVISSLENGNVFDNFLITNYVFDKMSYNRNFDLNDAFDIYINELISIKDRKLAVANATGALQADLLDLSVMYPKNYEDMLYDLAKIYYEYKKYLFDKENKSDALDDNMLKSIDKNLDDFLMRLKDDEEVLERVVNTFYEYVSFGNLDKDKIKVYYENLCKEGKAKVFSKKKRGSNH